MLWVALADFLCELLEFMVVHVSGILYPVGWDSTRPFCNCSMPVFWLGSAQVHNKAASWRCCLLAPFV